MPNTTFTPITSRANPLIVESAKLAADRKYRESAHLFCFEGKKLLSEALDAGVPLERVFAADTAVLRYRALLDRLSCPVYQVSDAVYEKLSAEKSPEGLFSVAKYLDNLIFPHTIYMKRSHFPTIIDSTDVENGWERILVCDGLQDPGNLGTVLRTANALGFDRVVLSKNSADIYHPKTLRGAMGALFRIPVDLAEDICAYIGSLKEAGYAVYAAALSDGAQPLPSLSVSERTVFVIGNEGHGLSSAVISACSGSVIIPMAEGAESLNAAVAAALLMWERAKVPSHDRES